MKKNNWLPPLVFKDGDKFGYTRIFLPEMLFIDCNWTRDVTCRTHELTICRPCYKQDVSGQELYENDVVGAGTSFCEILYEGGKWFLHSLRTSFYSELFNNGTLLTRLGNANDAEFMAAFKQEHPELFEVDNEK